MFRPVIFYLRNILMLRNRIPLIIKVSCYLSMSVFISQRNENHPQSHEKIHQHDDIWYRCMMINIQNSLSAYHTF